MSGEWDEDEESEEAKHGLRAALESRVLALLDRAEPAALDAALRALRSANPEHEALILELVAEHGAFTRSPETEDGKLRPTSIEHFEVHEIIGGGAWGVVHRARDQRLERDVALKFMHTIRLVEPRARQRFEREAQALAKLDHPGLCKIYELGETSGEPFLVMELLEGRSMDRIIDDARSQQEPRKNASEAAATVAQIARAMQAAHDVGIVHRDLKPANIMVEHDGHPVVYDFGLARPLEPATWASKLTRSGDLVGTIAYMAPELIDGGNAAPSTDIYALGVTLYELLTLRRPFDENTQAALLDAIRNQEPASIPKGVAPPALRNIIACALERDPSRRYGSCGKFADDLEQFCAGRPIEARPRSYLQHARRWRQRHPVTSAIVAVLALTTTFSTWMGLGWRDALASENKAHALTNTARTEERQAHGLRMLEAAHAAQQRGDAHAALAACSAAREAGLEDTVAIDLCCIEAYDALSEPIPGETLLLPLAAQTDAELGKHAPRVRLLEAYAKIGGEPQEIDALCARALALDSHFEQTTGEWGLTAAERAFAGALCAVDLAGLRRGLHQTLELDPSYLRAIALLGLVELLRGDMSTVLALTDRHVLLCPESWWPIALRFGALSIRGERDRAGELLAATAHRLPEDLRTVLELAGRTLARTHRQVEQLIEDALLPLVSFRTPATGNGFEYWSDIKAALDLLKSPRLQSTQRSLGIRIPPQLRDSLKPIWRYVPAILTGTHNGIMKMPEGSAEHAKAPFTIRLAAARSLAAQPAVDIEDKATLQQFHRILDLCRTPCEGIAIGRAFAGIRRYAAAFQLRVIANLLQSPEADREAWLQAAHELIREVAAEPTVTSTELFFLVSIAADDLNAPPTVMDWLFTRWRERFPLGSLSWRLEAELRRRRNEHAAARRCLDEALRLVPSDTKAKQMRAALIQPAPK